MNEDYAREQAADHPSDEEIREAFQFRYGVAHDAD